MAVTMITGRCGCCPRMHSIRAMPSPSWITMSVSTKSKEFRSSLSVASRQLAAICTEYPWLSRVAPIIDRRGASSSTTRIRAVFRGLATARVSPSAGRSTTASRTPNSDSFDAKSRSFHVLASQAMSQWRTPIEQSLSCKELPGLHRRGECPHRYLIGKVRNFYKRQKELSQRRFELPREETQCQQPAQCNRFDERCIHIDSGDACRFTPFA